MCSQKKVLILNVHTFLLWQFLSIAKVIFLSRTSEAWCAIDQWRAAVPLLYLTILLYLFWTKRQKRMMHSWKNLVRDLLTFHIGCPIYLLMYYVLGYCNVEKGRFLLSIKLLSVYSKNNPTTLFWSSEAQPQKRGHY